MIDLSTRMVGALPLQHSVKDGTSPFLYSLGVGVHWLTFQTLRRDISKP